jgi:hypothetical protein
LNKHASPLPPSNRPKALIHVSVLLQPPVPSMQPHPSSTAPKQRIPSCHRSPPPLRAPGALHTHHLHHPATLSAKTLHHKATVERLVLHVGAQHACHHVLNTQPTPLSCSLLRGLRTLTPASLVQGDTLQRGHSYHKCCRRPSPVLKEGHGMPHSFEGW